MSYDLKKDLAKENRRIEWIDICKFLAIAIMCMGHIGVPARISDLLHIFHMPVFFMLSGICFKEEKYKNFSLFFVSRFKSLLIPHYFWSVVMYVVWRLYCKFSMMGSPVSLHSFFWMLLTKDATDVQFGGFGVIQWFFTSLFFTELLFYGVVKASNIFKRKKEVLFTLSLILAFIGYLISKVTSYNPLGMVGSFMGVIFYAIGYLFWQCQIGNSKTKKNEYLIDLISFIACSVIVLIVWFKNGSTNMRTSTYNNFFLFVLGAVAGSYIMIQFSRYMVMFFKNKNSFIFRFFLYIGQNTLCVLIFNRLVQFTVVKLVNSIMNWVMGVEFFSTLYGQVFMGIIDLIVEMIAVVPIIWLVNRYLPATIGKRRKILE